VPLINAQPWQAISKVSSNSAEHAKHGARRSLAHSQSQERARGVRSHGSSASNARSASYKHWRHGASARVSAAITLAFGLRDETRFGGTPVRIHLKFKPGTCSPSVADKSLRPSSAEAVAARRGDANVEAPFDWYAARSSDHTASIVQAIRALTEPSFRLIAVQRGGPTNWTISRSRDAYERR